MAWLGTTVACSSELLNPQTAEQRAADAGLYTSWSLDPDRLEPSTLLGGQGYGGAQRSLWVEDTLGIDTPASRAALDQQVYERGWGDNAAALPLGGECNLTRLGIAFDLAVWWQQLASPTASFAPLHSTRTSANDAQFCGRSHAC